MMQICSAYTETLKPHTHRVLMLNTSDISISVGKVGNKQIARYFKERNFHGFMVFGTFCENLSQKILFYFLSKK